jgi:predicted metal-dependent peptidase
MLRAMEAGRQAGTGIGLLGGVIADIAQPRIPWERQLRGLLARALMEEPRQTWRRPSGRWAAMDADARARGGAEPVFQPGRQRSTWRPRIVVGIDTSSSIDALTLRLFVAEAEGIARRTGAETHLLAFDTQIHHEERLRPGQRLLLEGLSLRTGGGTDFGAALARAAQLAPSIVVLLTDLDGPVGTAPRSPVLWVVQDGAPEAPFGRVLRIPD